MPFPLDTFLFAQSRYDAVRAAGGTPTEAQATYAAVFAGTLPMELPPSPATAVGPETIPPAIDPHRLALLERMQRVVRDCAHTQLSFLEEKVKDLEAFIDTDDDYTSFEDGVTE